MPRYCGHYYCFSTSILIFEVLKWSAVSKFSLVAVGKVHLYLRGVCWLKSCWCAGFLSASSNFPYLRVWLISSCLHLDVCHSSLDLTAYANAKKKIFWAFLDIYIYSWYCLLGFGCHFVFLTSFLHFLKTELYHLRNLWLLILYELWERGVFFFW